MQILGVDAACRYQLQTAVGSEQRFDHIDAAQRLRREELDSGQPQFQRQLNVGGAGTAGQDGITLLKAVADHPGVKPGGDDVARACRGGLVSLLGGQHRAGAQQHLRQFLMHEADGFFRRRGPESNFRHRQAAF